ncbi:IS66 family transposase [Tunicatimonas pelagia]|uniref:IS66 family transposase n=1 Tax=Tunicatimonas pelagia TaxID=931531 RepID=UPI00266580C3|nr:IS66 family transposase [Tunicatimonas pelagia]WKN44963.1 IS66 family transposase [Tunicatimonas pelagia]WKN46223.1 IS66 family transposase [Tunicatimonas pelagia]
MDAALRAENQALREQNEVLRQELAELKRLVFGSERFIGSSGEGQLSLLAEEPDIKRATPEKQTYSQKVPKSTTVTPPSRKLLPAHLPRVEVVLEPEEDTSNMKKIGEQVSEELDYEPAKLFVRRYVRPRYVSNEETFHMTALPNRPIDKGIPGSGLLAQILMDKFVDHLPVYRQVQRYERLGIKLSESTLGGWLSSTCQLLTPLYDALRQCVLSQTYLQADETPIPVLDKKKKGKTHRGYQWAYHSVKDRLVFFDYQPGRGREGPKECLKNFQGYLQTDGYEAYEWLNAQRDDITLLHCMAHARRYFEKALDSDAERAGHALSQIQKLYAVERHARQADLSDQQRYVLRQQQAVPVLEELHAWLLEQATSVLPKSLIGKAATYSLRRIKTLSLYTSDGRLEIDNNLIENTIRPIALGRKNYLFAGSHAAAQRIAVFYSLLGSCKLHNIEPYSYLKDILERLPDHPISQIDELLPHRWKPRLTKQEERLSTIAV